MVVLFRIRSLLLGIRIPVLRADTAIRNYKSGSDNWFYPKVQIDAGTQRSLNYTEWLHRPQFYRFSAHILKCLIAIFGNDNKSYIISRLFLKRWIVIRIQIRIHIWIRIHEMKSYKCFQCCHTPWSWWRPCLNYEQHLCWCRGSPGWLGRTPPQSPWNIPSLSAAVMMPDVTMLETS